MIALSKEEISAQIESMKSDLIYWQHKHERQKREYTKMKVRELSQTITRWEGYLQNTKD